MAVLQTQGVHHITMVGSNREATVEFYSGLLGMPLIFTQRNLDVPEEEHLYFDPGDGRLLTFFVRPSRDVDPTPNPEGIGNLHHLAFNVSRATFEQVSAELEAREIKYIGPLNRHFMDSIYFRDPNGQLIELACFKFQPPEGYRIADVLLLAHQIRVAASEEVMEEKHIAEAIAQLVKRHTPVWETDEIAKSPGS